MTHKSQKADPAGKLHSNLADTVTWRIHGEKSVQVPNFWCVMIPGTPLRVTRRRSARMFSSLRARRSLREGGGGWVRTTIASAPAEGVRSSRCGWSPSGGRETERGEEGGRRDRGREVWPTLEGDHQPRPLRGFQELRVTACTAVTLSPPHRLLAVWPFVQDGEM